MKRFGILFLLSVIMSVPLFSYEISDVGFPYKGFVYRFLEEDRSQFDKSQLEPVEVDGKVVETPKLYEFMYKGVHYKAELRQYGMIYLEVVSEAEDKPNPRVIWFDMKLFNHWMYKTTKPIRGSYY